MKQGDFVAVPELRCEVAARAMSAWHDDIKNGLLWWSDGERLARRLGDASAIRELEAHVRFVAEHIGSLSGASLVAILKPLSLLRPELRERLSDSLQRTFESAFKPNDVARELGQELDLLLALVRRYAGLQTSGGEGERRTLLEEIREGARALGAVLAALPRGFWLPRPPDDDAVTR